MQSIYIFVSRNYRCILANHEQPAGSSFPWVLNGSAITSSMVPVVRAALNIMTYTVHNTHYKVLKTTYKLKIQDTNPKYKTKNRKQTTNTENGKQTENMVYNVCIFIVIISCMLKM